MPPTWSEPQTSRGYSATASNGRKPRKPGAVQKSKPGARERLAELDEQVRQIKERAQLVLKAVPQATAAQEELRRTAAEWVAAIRDRVTALSAEVNRVVQASQPGTVLHGLFDHVRLSALARALGEADCEGAGLYVFGHDMPIPGLLLLRDRICREQFPLAEAGAKVGFEELQSAVHENGR